MHRAESTEEETASSPLSKTFEDLLLRRIRKARKEEEPSSTGRETEKSSSKPSSSLLHEKVELFKKAAYAIHSWVGRGSYENWPDSLPAYVEFLKREFQGDFFDEASFAKMRAIPAEEARHVQVRLESLSLKTQKKSVELQLFIEGSRDVTTETVALSKDGHVEFSESQAKRLVLTSENDDVLQLKVVKKRKPQQKDDDEKEICSWTLALSSIHREIKNHFKINLKKTKTGEEIGWLTVTIETKNLNLPPANERVNEIIQQRLYEALGELISMDRFRRKELIELVQKKSAAKILLTGEAEEETWEITNFTEQIIKTGELGKTRSFKPCDVSLVSGFPESGIKFKCSAAENERLALSRFFRLAMERGEKAQETGCKEMIRNEFRCLMKALVHFNSETSWYESQLVAMIHLSQEEESGNIPWNCLLELMDEMQDANEVTKLSKKALLALSDFFLRRLYQSYANIDDLETKDQTTRILLFVGEASMQIRGHGMVEKIRLLSRHRIEQTFRNVTSLGDFGKYFEEEVMSVRDELRRSFDATFERVFGVRWSDLFCEAAMDVCHKTMKELMSKELKKRTAAGQDDVADFGRMTYKLFNNLREIAETAGEEGTFFASIKKKPFTLLELHATFEPLLLIWANSTASVAATQIERVIQQEQALLQKSGGKKDKEVALEDARNVKQVFHRCRVVWEDLNWPDLHKHVDFGSVVLAKIHEIYQGYIAKKYELIQEDSAFDRHELVDILNGIMHSVEYLQGFYETIEALKTNDDSGERDEAIQGAFEAYESNLVKFRSEAMTKAEEMVDLYVRGQREPFSLCITNENYSEMSGSIEQNQLLIRQELEFADDELKSKFLESLDKGIFEIAIEEMEIKLKKIIKENKAPTEEHFEDFSHTLMSLKEASNVLGVEDGVRSKLTRLQENVTRATLGTPELIRKYLHSVCAQRDETKEDGPHLKFRVTLQDDDKLRLNLLCIENLKASPAFRLTFQIIPTSFFSSQENRTVKSKIYRDQTAVLFDLREKSEHEIDFELEEGNKDVFVCVSLFDYRVSHLTKSKSFKGNVLCSLLTSMGCDALCKHFSHSYSQNSDFEELRRRAKEDKQAKAFVEWVETSSKQNNVKTMARLRSEDWAGESEIEDSAEE